MSTFFISLLVKLWSLVMALILTAAPGGALAGEEIQPADEDNLKLNFSVLADAHIESYTFWRFQDLRRGLLDINRAEAGSDALVLLGDNTMNGQFTEYTQLYSILTRWNTSKNTLAAMGNHDVNPSKNTIDEAVARHNRFFNGYTGAKNDKPYYAREINGYTFIVLGSEDEHGGVEDGTYAWFSPEQIAWLDAELAKAAEPGKPIFVFNHQPLLEEHWEWGTAVPGEEAFEVLKKYDHVIYFNGHTHQPASMLTEEGVTFINTPHFSNEGAGGPGFYVEVYETRVLVRERAFANGAWTNLEMNIGL